MRSFKLITAPVLRAKMTSAQPNGWPSGAAYPILRGECSLEGPNLSLQIQCSGVSGSYSASGSELIYRWRDTNADPTWWLLYGKHDIGERWNGEPLYLGFGVSVELATGIDFTTGTPKYNWGFLGCRRLPLAWAQIDLRTDGSGNPALLFRGNDPTGAEQEYLDGSRKIVGRRARLKLGFDTPVLLASVRGDLDLQQALRSPVVVLPDFDPSTVLSVPLARTRIPDIGPSPLARSVSGYARSTTAPAGAHEVLAYNLEVDRRDRSAAMRGLTLEPAIENKINPSSPFDGSDGGWVKPSTNGHATALLDYVHGTPEEANHTVLAWHRGTDAQDITITKSVAASGELWVFSTWLRGCGRLIGGNLNVTISGTGSNTSESASLGSAWSRVTVAGIQSGSSVTVTLSLNNEGEIVLLCGWQLEKAVGIQEAPATTLIPCDGIGTPSRAAEELIYPQPVSGDQGTLSVVFFPQKNGGVSGGDTTRIVLLSAYDTGSSAHALFLWYTFQATAGQELLIGWYYPSGSYEGSGTLSWDYDVANPAIVTLLLSPDLVGGENKTKFRLYGNGTLLDTQTQAIPARLSDQVRVAPETNLPTIAGEEAAPFRGQILLARYDAAAMDTTEVAEYGAFWSSDVALDLATITMGRRFRPATQANPIAGNENYILPGLTLAQVDDHPPAYSPSPEFHE